MPSLSYPFQQLESSKSYEPKLFQSRYDKVIKNKNNHHRFGPSPFPSTGSKTGNHGRNYSKARIRLPEEMDGMSDNNEQQPLGLGVMMVSSLGKSLGIIGNSSNGRVGSTSVVTGNGRSMRKLLLQGIGCVIVFLGFIKIFGGEITLFGRSKYIVNLPGILLKPKPTPHAIYLEWGKSYTSSSLLKGLIPTYPSTPVSDPTKPLSSLGYEADSKYSLSSTDYEEYMNHLNSFVELTLPVDWKKEFRIQNSLTAGGPGGGGAGQGGGGEGGSGGGDGKGRGEYGKLAWDDNKNVWQVGKDHLIDDVDIIRGWRDGSFAEHGWKWRLLDDDEGKDWVASNLTGSRLADMYNMLPAGILNADTLRYMLLARYGGIYADTDCQILKQASDWGRNPKLWRDGKGWMASNDIKSVLSAQDKNAAIDRVLGRPRILLGIEADVGDRPDWFDWWPRPVSIVQWTMGSAPNHPIMLDTLLRILHHTANAIDFAHDHRKKMARAKKSRELDELDRLEHIDVLSDPKNGGPYGVVGWTGPAVFTDSVLSYLRARYGINWTDLKDLREPLRVGDVVILPVTGFSPGVGNFGAGAPWDEQAMVEHRFSNIWKNH